MLLTLVNATGGLKVLRAYGEAPRPPDSAYQIRHPSPFLLVQLGFVGRTGDTRAAMQVHDFDWHQSRSNGARHT